MKKSFFLKTSLYSLIILLTALLATIVIVKLVNRQNDELVSHDYVETTITKKYYTDGYGGFYYYKDTSFVLVSEGGNMVYTNYVSEEIYNAYEVGDVIYVCTKHNKVKNFETNGG